MFENRLVVSLRPGIFMKTAETQIHRGGAELAFRVSVEASEMGNDLSKLYGRVDFPIEITIHAAHHNSVSFVTIIARSLDGSPL